MRVCKCSTTELFGHKAPEDGFEPPTTRLEGEVTLTCAPATKKSSREEIERGTYVLLPLSYPPAQGELDSNQRHALW